MATPRPALLCAVLIACRATENGNPDATKTTPDSRDTAGDSRDTAPDTAAIDLPAALQALDLSGQNLVLIHVDTVRIDRLGLYGTITDGETGGLHDTTPALSARGGLVVRGLQATTSWTAPSTASLLTGLDPHHHNVRYAAPGGVLNDTLDEPGLIAALTANGYATMLASGNPWASSERGVARGFDREVVIEKRYPDNNLSALAREAGAWLDDLPAGQPFFLMLQPMNLHSPYFTPDGIAGSLISPADLPFRPQDTGSLQEQSINAAYQTDPEATRTAVRLAYDEQILALDLAVEALIADLERRGLADRTLIVLTGDHGETLGDHGSPRFGHGDALDPELVHEPLVLFHPDLPVGEAGCLASNTDTLPTLLAALGVGLPPGLDGAPLQQGCRDLARSSLYKEDGDIMALAVSDPQRYLLYACADGRPILSDWQADPAGATMLIPEEYPGWPALAQAMNDLHAEIAGTLGAACAIAPDL